MLAGPPAYRLREQAVRHRAKNYNMQLSQSQWNEVLDYLTSLNIVECIPYKEVAEYYMDSFDLLPGLHGPFNVFPFL